MNNERQESLRDSSFGDLAISSPTTCMFRTTLELSKHILPERKFMLVLTFKVCFEIIVGEIIVKPPCK